MTDRSDHPMGICLSEAHPGSVTIGGSHYGFGCRCGLPEGHEGQHCCNIPNATGCGAIWEDDD